MPLSEICIVPPISFLALHTGTWVSTDNAISQEVSVGLTSFPSKAYSHHAVSQLFILIPISGKTYLGMSSNNLCFLFFLKKPNSIT